MLFRSALIMLYLEASGILFQYVPMNAATRFIPYFSYFLLGSFLRRRPASKYLGFFAFITFLIATAFIAAGTARSVEQFGRNDFRAFIFYDHFNAWVLIQSVSIFLTFQWLFDSFDSFSSSKPIILLGQMSFGVYLSHAFFLDALRGYTDKLSSLPVLLVISLEVAGVFAVSILFTYLLSKFRFTRIIVGSN